MRSMCRCGHAFCRHDLDERSMQQPCRDCRCESFGNMLPDQPPPKPNKGPVLWLLVIEDICERDRVGRERYGTPLQPHNGRDALVDAYQEALDLCVYLRQAICERDGR